MRRKRWSRRRVAIAMVAAAFGALIGIVLLTPAPRTLLLDQALSWLHRQYGIVGTVGRVDLDLAPFRVSATNLRFAAEGRGAAPFLTIDDLRVELPWAALWGGASGTVTVTRPAVSIVRSADGSSNLPAAAARADDAASRPPGLLPVGNLEIRDLTAAWRDDASGWRVELAPTSLRLNADQGIVRGRLGSRGESIVARGDVQTRIVRLDGDLGFDGAALDIHRLTVAAPEGEVTIRGRVEELLARPRLDLGYAARLDMAGIAPWLAAGPVAGTLSAEGRASGRLDTLAASVTIAGDGLAWRAARADRVAATVQLIGSELRLDALDLTLAGGRLSAAGGLTGNDARAGRLTARWRDLDADQLLSAFGVELPIALGTTAAGTVDARWDALDLRAVEVSAANRFGWDEESGGVQIEAAGGRWRMTVDERLAGVAHVTGQVETRVGEDWRRAPLSGAMTATCDDLVRCRGAAERWGAPAGPMPLEGRATVSARLAGTLGQPRASAILDAPRLTIGPIGATEIDARLAIDLTALVLERARLRAGDNEVTAEARLAWADGGIEGWIAATAGDLSILAPLVPAGWAPAGRGRVDAAVRGRLGAVQADAVLALGPVAIAGQQFVSATGRLRLDGSRVAVEALRVVREGARLDAAGRYDGRDATFAVAVTAEDFPITPLFPGSVDEIGIAARVSLEAEGGGTLDDPHGTGQVTLADLAWADYRPGPVDARIRVASHRMHAEARLPDLDASVETTLDIDGDGAFEVRGAVVEADLARLFGVGGPVSGAITADATAAGHLLDLGAARVELRIARLAGAIGGAGVGIRRPAAFSYQAGDLEAHDVEVALGGTRLHLDGGLTASGDATLTARLAGRATDLGQLAAGLAPADSPLRDMEAAGTLSVELTATGSPDAVDLSGQMRIDNGSIALGDLPPLTDISLRASVRDGALQVEALRAAWAGATLAAWATLPADFAADALPGALSGRYARGRPARLHAELGSLTPAMLAAFVDPVTIAPLTGMASAVLDLELPSPAWEGAGGRLTLPEASFLISGVPMAQRRPTEALLDRGRVTLTTFDWGNDHDYVTAGGTLDLGEAATADLTITGELDLRAVSAFAPTIATAGVARLIADVTGTLNAPQVRGTVEVEDGELRMNDPRLIVSDLTGALLLTGDTLVVHELTGDANGGRVEVGGQWSLGGPSAENALFLTGTGMALDVPDGLRSEVDVAVRFAGGGARVLSGTATIRRGEYREPLSLAGGLLALLQQSPAVAAVGVNTGGGSASRPIGLDVHVTTADDIVVDNNYLEAEIAGDLQVAGTVERPAVTGRVAVREGGRVRFGNRVYEIDTGVVDLVDPTGIEPELTLTARTRAGSYDVTLEASGGRDDLTTELRSEPPLPEADIVSVLVTGRTLEQASAAPVAGAREQALGLVSNELLGQVSENVGLDVRVGSEAPDAGGNIRLDSSLIATELNPGTRLTVGRDLSRQVRLIVSRDLRESDLAWIVDYLPRDNVELRAFFNDANERAYEFRHALSRGAPLTRHDAPPGAATPAPRVTAVRFSGTPAIDTAQLRGIATLESGDRFDFLRWQRDRDRLAAYYVEQGFREARVRARRERQVEAGAVRLEYEITRGPRTDLVVTGHDLPASVRRDLDVLWSRAVFDTFLVEELAERATRHLIDEGYVHPVVDVRIERDAERNAKRIAMAIDPGPRTEDRQLRYEGLTTDGESAVHRFVTTRRLDRVAWTEPSRFADAVAAWYRERGRLQAAVAVGDPRVAGRTALLPVRIDEGPVFRIGAIALTGFASRSEAELRDLLMLHAGGVYTAAALSAASARVAASYRADGYTTARVSAQIDVDAAHALVDVDVTISEGTRQVIEAVTVEGAPRTHPGLVAGALRFGPGDPVDLAAWTQARKRLYDTGVFRSVDLEAREPDSAPDGGTIPVEARIVLEEWPVYRVRYGLRLADDLAPLSESALGESARASPSRRRFRLGAASDVTRRNLFGRGLTAGVASRIDLDRQAARAFLTIPRLFGRGLETNLFAGRRREAAGADADAAAFVTDTTTFTAEQRFRPNDHLTVAYSANLDDTHTFDRNPDPDFPFDVRARIARFDGSVLVDTRNSPFDATTGTFHASNIEYGFEPGGALTFVKYRAQHFAYRTLGPVVLASAGRLGLATGFGGALMPLERFFAGGGNTVRGYAQDSLGPLNVFGARAGGNALLILNQEIRVPIVWRFRGVGFVDAGNVFESIADFSLRGLQTSAGVGLRIESPVGLVRLDYGFALQRAEGEPRGLLFFSLGQTF